MFALKCANSTEILHIESIPLFYSYMLYLSLNEDIADRGVQSLQNRRQRDRKKQIKRVFIVLEKYNTNK